MGLTTMHLKLFAILMLHHLLFLSVEVMQHAPCNLQLAVKDDTFKLSKTAERKIHIKI